VDAKEDSHKALKDLMQRNKYLIAAVTAQTHELKRQQHQQEHRSHGFRARLHDKQFITDAPAWEPQSTRITTGQILRTVKANLFFSCKDDRYEYIEAAHRKTFDWALQDQSLGTWSNLVKWLRVGHGLLLTICTGL
jgi:hypothetical protein